MGELDLELPAAGPGAPMHAAQHHHAIAGVEEVVGVRPTALHMVLGDGREGLDAIVSVPRAAPGQRVRQAPFDVVRHVADELIHVPARERVVDAPQRLDFLLGHGLSSAPSG